MYDRTDMILQYFSFLISEYSFRIEKKEYDASAMGNCFIVFVSSRIGIEVVIDRDQVLIAVGDQLTSRDKWFDFSYVYQYFSNTTDSPYKFPPKTGDNTWDEIVDIQLQRLSDLLKQYCVPLLKGDLSMQKEFKVREQKYTKSLMRQLDRISTKNRNDKAK